jgi:hypothetical protein
MEEPSYTIKPSVLIYMCGVCVAGLLIALLLNPHILVTFWNERNWIARLSLILGLALLMLVPVEVFLKRTTFSSKGIEHRSLIGIKTYRNYNDIEALEYGYNSLKIIFSDGSDLEIWLLKKDLKKVNPLLEYYLPKEILIKVTY